MNLSIGEELGLVADLLALRNAPELRESTRRVIDRLIEEAQRNRARRGRKRKRKDGKRRSSTCGHDCDRGRAGGRAPRITVTVRPR